MSPVPLPVQTTQTTSQSTGYPDDGSSLKSLSTSIEDIVDLRIGSDKEILTALSELSKLPDTSIFSKDIRSRKANEPDLRTLIENQQISMYKTFLHSFNEIKEDVKCLENELFSLNSVCESMATNLTTSKQSSRTLIDEIAKLENERKKIVQERDLARAYLNAFQLDSDELKVLRGTENTTEPLSVQFFTVFEKIQRIQQNVSILMKIGHQTTALEIMDQLSLFQETALEKIYRWAQVNCKNVENPELAEILSKSLSYLQIRPMLLKYVLDEYCVHRRSLVVRSFIDALTGVGSIKGIELIGSTDPTRYIGDMLAWIHQEIPGEKENLLILLKYCNKNDLEEKITTSLATILDGVCRPLNVRIEQTLLSGLDCILMNKIDILIQFYVATVEQAVSGSNLLVTLRELQTLCHQTFVNQLKIQVQVELGEFRHPGSDLSPPTSIKTMLTILKELLHESRNSNPEHTQSLISLIVTPLVSQVNDISNRLGSPDMGVYLCNCLNEIIKTLDSFVPTTPIHKALVGQIESQIDRLSSEQSSWLVAQLGIGHIYTILHEKIEEPLSTVPGMDAASLNIFVNKLDTLMTNPESVLLPQIIHISDQNTKKTIQGQSFRILVAIYKQVYEAVVNPKNQYPKDLLYLEPSKLEESLCSGPL